MPFGLARVVHDGGSTTVVAELCGQFFNGSGIAAAGIGSVHELWMTSSAHRSPLFFTLLALLADTILLREIHRQFRFRTELS